MSLRRIVLFGLFTVVVFAAAPSGCGSAEPVVLPPEDCTVPGDEDESGLADCDDPTCWQPGVCEEVCDSGWDEDGDGEVRDQAVEARVEAPWLRPAGQRQAGGRPSYFILFIWIMRIIMLFYFL